MTTAGMVKPQGDMPLDLDRGAGHTIDPSLVPASLQHLIPLVEKWAFKDLNDQDVFVTAMLRDRPAEVIAFSAAVDSHERAIMDWSKQLKFPDNHMSEITDDEWRHPYWLFQTLFKVREICGYEDTPEFLAFRQRISEDLRKQRFAGIAVAADDAFRRADYSLYIELMVPYEDLLTATQKTKLALCRKKSGA